MASASGTMPESLGSQFVTKSYAMKGKSVKKAFWDKPNPKRKSKPLTASQKAAAKRRAKKAGRPYPNLVDNAAVRRKRK